ncbi:MFS transporter [Sphaerisporangium krabiense]|uniref:GPH family glycoside/pentoside/hexuronide:cation symporter n=1 Tax=Sphaerisporangium krabiense TaxID=763782 RepID=A0A7W8Z648_9ACTN|nr:MFS transporter [Sphaerisporangium krabiense]MBB5627808.1 GPH family glycoside/pentoside/hexuronide:cation symporter [Sphaerisporangium krabiense]GII61967.1 MFS transporter [Sphaerisporangium krabiense]
MVPPPEAPVADGVSRGVRLGYGVGSFCTATFTTVPGLLLLFYLTNILAVPAWLAGLIVFAPKAWDLFANPLVGQWSDRTVSRWGPRRPWMLAGALILPVSFALTFAGPPLKGVPAALFVGVFFLLAATGYALYEVPYKAMPAEMTEDYHERTSLLQWRMIFIALAVALSGIIAPEIAAHSLDGYRVMGIVCGAVLLAAMLASFLGTARAPFTGSAEPEAGLRAQLAAARDSRPFLWLLGLSCAQTLAAGVMLAAAPYFAAYIAEDTSATSTLFAALVGPMLVTMPLWVWIARRMDKRGAMLLSGVLFMGGALLTVLTPLLGMVYAHAMIVIVGVGYAGLQLLQFSMLADVIAHDSAVSGKRRGGVFTGLWTAAENVVTALGALVVGAGLAMGGFVSSDPENPVTQPGGAVTAVLLVQTVVPALITFAGVLMTLKYRLTAAHLASATPRTT